MLHLKFTWSHQCNIECITTYTSSQFPESFYQCLPTYAYLFFIVPVSWNVLFLIILTDEFCFKPQSPRPFLPTPMKVPFMYKLCWHVLITYLCWGWHIYDLCSNLLWIIHSFMMFTCTADDLHWCTDIGLHNHCALFQIQSQRPIWFETDLFMLTMAPLQVCCILKIAMKS